MLTALSLIDELEHTMRQGSAAQRAVILQRVTDLFLQHAEDYGEEQVALFDDVMNRLVERIEQQALVQLSTQLAPVANAPVNIVQRLARDDDIAVASPVIERSRALTDEVLVEIANSKSQQHLVAIAGRNAVSETVTDALVERGDNQVTLKVTGNAGARFSRNAYRTIASRASSDESLARTMVDRHDVPPEIFEELLTKATDVVRQRLMKDAGPAARERIEQTLAAISDSVTPSAATAASMAAMPQQWLKLRLGELARQGRRSDTIAALAVLSNLPTEAVQSLLRAETEDGVMIICKAIGLSWTDSREVLAVLTGRGEPHLASDSAAADKYARLTVDTAHRVVQFVKACKMVSRSELRQML